MLEIACFNASSAIEAAQAGADRIELCADYDAGGVTPSAETLQATRKEVKIPINVMIRPRSGNFNYTTEEFNEMKSDIKRLSPDASGFVFGILDVRNHLDQQRNAELVQSAAPLPCTFHRAFDQVCDMSEATEKIIGCGFKSILTSGGPSNAVEGVKATAELHAKFGDRIAFILGGGVRSKNIGFLKRRTNVKWYHSAAITKPGEMADKQEIEQLKRIEATTLTNCLHPHFIMTKEGTPLLTFQDFPWGLDGGVGTSWLREQT